VTKIVHVDEGVLVILAINGKIG